MKSSANNNAMVSIIIPIHNMERFLSKSISSCLKQTYKNIEILLINDGSSDKSLEICEEFKKKDERINVISEFQKGVGEARNRGVFEAKGTFILFVDPDDWIDEKCVSLLIEKQKSGNFDLVIGGFEKVNENGDGKRDEWVPKQSFEFNNKTQISQNYWNILGSAIIASPWKNLYKKEIILSNNIFFPNYGRTQDAFFNVEYLSHIQSLSYFTDCIYYYYSPKTSMFYKKIKNDYYQTICRLFDYSSKCGQEINCENDSISFSKYCSSLFGPITTNLEANISRKESIKPILGSDTIVFICEKAKPFGIYQRLCKTFIIKKHFFLLKIILKIKVFIRKHICK